MTMQCAADAVTGAADVRELANVARARIGLKLGFSTPKIEALLRAVPADDRVAFCRELIRSEPDATTWRAFSEALLVHETYFFRHPDQLRLLGDVVLPRLLQDRLDAGSTELRIWCAGCSSGEETYSLALLLQAAIAESALPLVQAWNATVLGTDLSARTLELARAGSYALAAGLNSFRDVPSFARHHFAAILDATQSTWSASAELRRLTRFAQHNLVRDPPALRDVDLVVCRNTLIYFDEVQTRSALASLEAALRPGGALLLGPAETASEGGRLDMVCTEQAVFWRKKAAR
jgi:chemotaxis methyl-accepting protein methylase